MSSNNPSKISYFLETTVNEISLPERFTFPFAYVAHPLAQIAATELQHYLDTQTHLDHNFGLIAGKAGVVDGKMFGVLVVQDTAGRLGYLSAFSGKLAGSNHHPGFVPPVFDMLAEDSFFVKEIVTINALNARMKEIEGDKNYQHLKRHVEELSAQSLNEISAFREQMIANKASRNQAREMQKSILTRPEYDAAEAERVRHSLHDKHQLHILRNRWKQMLEAARSGLNAFERDIETLKSARKGKSTALQQQLFKQYVFLNKDGQSKSLQEIFNPMPTGKLPAGAGECATPKLLQFAFANGYKPLAMAEFWWGASPKSEVRKHKQYYPACTGKCKPILAHMLEGIPVDENPFPGGIGPAS